jgi:hypothetical protein
MKHKKIKNSKHKKTKTKKEEVKIQRIAVWPLGKVLAIIMFVIGIFQSIVVLISELLIAQSPVADYQTIILRPFAALISGFVFGVVFAAIYNWVSGFTGQIKIEVDEKKIKK